MGPYFALVLLVNLRFIKFYYALGLIGLLIKLCFLVVYRFYQVLSCLLICGFIKFLLGTAPRISDRGCQVLAGRLRKLTRTTAPELEPGPQTLDGNIVRNPTDRPCLEMSKCIIVQNRHVSIVLL